MNLTVGATYIVLSGLIILLLVLLLLNRKKEVVEINDALLRPEELEKHAVEIARNHTIGKDSRALHWLIARVKENFKFIQSVNKRLNAEVDNMFPTASSAEWLLDNFYVIEEQVREIMHLLSKSRYNKLPVLDSGYLRGYPRVFAVALELVAHTDGKIDEDRIIGFLRAYQSQKLLSMNELWTLTIMLKIALLENIRYISEKIIETQEDWHRAEYFANIIADSQEKDEPLPLDAIVAYLKGTQSPKSSFLEHLILKLRKQGSKSTEIIHYIDTRLAEVNSSADALIALEHQLQASRQISMGNSITSLRSISNIDWADIFEVLSSVEEILREDPSGIYSQMDFESRDYYRHQIEKLANSLNSNEIRIARAAVECAEEAAANFDAQDPQCHVGYYIIGKGKGKLKREIGYRPRGLKAVGEKLSNHSARLYIGSIVLITLLGSGLFAHYSASHLPGMLYVCYFALTMVIAFIPVSELVIPLTNCVLSRLRQPTMIPKLELKEGIPEESSTMVIIPTLLPNEKRVRELIERLEIFYLANKERNLYFALVGDYKDSSSEELPEDEKIISAALRGVEELNKRYKQEDSDIFYFFHRHRQYNESQGKWMGWERKRGAIVELVELFRGSENTSYSIVSSDINKLPFIKYIITIDADTSLPMGAARRLIGTMLHPMNKPVVDYEKSLVVEGYGLLQPRISVDVVSANATHFSRIFAGQGGIDPYTTAVSDIYQDLFNEGIFTGKGIFDVDVFNDILTQAIPDNAVLSHDLLEGSYIRAGLVTDIELVDGYPARYNSFSMRLHRWVRGDWQLLPWLRSKVINRSGQLVDNPLSGVSKWKILDNMRRSLLSPAIMILILAGISILPGNILVWLGLALAAAASPVIAYVIGYILSGEYHIGREKCNSTVIRGMRGALYQSVLIFTFVAYQAYLMTDAIIRTVGRVLFTKKNMLEWVTAADVEATLKNDFKSFWKRMWMSAFLGVLAFLLAMVSRPSELGPVAILMLLWIAAPYIAYSISKPYRKERPHLSLEDFAQLRTIARKTWRFFEDFAVESDNYLPPDNYQEDPPTGVAHRTSPTNIGFLLASVLSARDVGYIGTTDMVDRIERTITTIEKMEKWNGHLYNWYDTNTLRILKPLYVSTVDSGNFIGCLMVVEEGLKEYLKKPIVDFNLAQGIKDTIEILREDEGENRLLADTYLLDSFIEEQSIDIASWNSFLEKLDKALLSSHLRQNQDGWSERLHETVETLKKELQVILPGAVLNVGRKSNEVNPSGSHREADDGNAANLRNYNTDEKQQNKDVHYEIVARLAEAINRDSSPLALRKEYEQALSELDRVMEGQEDSSDLYAGLSKLRQEIVNAHENTTALIERCRKLTERIRVLCNDMKFAPLYDPKRQLFAIGYNVEEGRLSKSYYDLLASEARQASFIAIARGEVNQKHWFRLGRTLVMIDRFKGLISWTGTMFEYLLPLLLMKSYENTLLDETYRFVVKNQKKYGRQRNLPWGISESSYNAFDLNLNYQYKAFGIPELGLKRGLGNDLVVAPYASILALTVDPKGVAENIRRLRKEGVESLYGLYEAVDYTAARLRKDEEKSIIKSFMAHHQGMIMLALNNFFSDNIMQKRFHANPMIKSAELLLQEKIPTRITFTKEHKKDNLVFRKTELEDGEVVRSFGIPESQLPNVHILSNGSYSVMVTDGGAGYSKNGDIGVTRWKESPREGNSGIFIYIQNINSNMGWSAAYNPCNYAPEKYKVVFSPDKIEFMRKDGNIETHTEITVSPEDNAEIRRVSLTNRSQHARELEITSYMEVIITHPEADAAHPAFSNLFVRTEFVHESNCLLASRRPRSEDQEVIWAAHAVSVEGETVGDIQYETDRFKFIGRNRDLSCPVALDVDRPLTNTAGSVLDPIMSLRRRVRIPPGQTARVTFVVAVAHTRINALEIAEKYRDQKAIERAFELAWTRSQIETRYLGFKTRDVEQYLYMLPHIIFPSPHRRNWSDIIMKNTMGQAGLWPMGISGDLPIVLAVITTREESFVRWLLKAHEFWRMKGLIIDLVMLIEDEKSYTQPLQDMIRDAVAGSHARDMVDKRGGVFVRNAGIISEEEKTLLYAAARIVLKDSGEPVHEQLEPVRDEMPLLLPDNIIEGDQNYRADEQSQNLSSAGIIQSAGKELKYFNGIGGFSADGSEYVILLRGNLQTPTPWINVISNSQFGFQVSETGSGYTWAENSRENKLTPWSNDPVSDPPGEVLYLRDEKNGSFWSITPEPIREEKHFIVRHGFGYSVFQHSSHGLDQTLTVFAALEDPVKLQLVTLKNTSGEERTLTLTYYIRPVLGVDQYKNAPYIITDYKEDEGIFLVSNPFNNDFPGRVCFIHSSEDKGSHTGDRTEFLGINGSLYDPEAMRRKELSGRTGAGFDPCAAIRVEIKLGVGENKDVVFLLGQCRNKEETVDLIRKYRSVSNAKSELERVKKFWKDLLQTVQVSTPEPSMDVMLNGWLLYQVISCRIWARSAFYQSGGAYGFRDQLQDVMAVTHVWPELTRRQIILHASHQFKEGDVQHWWHPGQDKGIRTRYSDDLVWLAFVTADYVRRTGDRSILDEEAPYLESEPLADHEDERYDIPRLSSEKSTVYEHCIRAIDRALKFGDHGIPLMGSGDWNDGMNTVGNKGKGESVWLGWFLYYVLDNFIHICLERNDNERAERYRTAMEDIISSIEKNAWDGSWYRRAYFDDGTPLGSVQNDECRIDAIAQSWSAISGAGKPARVEEAMHAVENYLVDKEEGIIKLLAPPFDKGSLRPGYIKSYLPGVRENGGQYTHAAVWVILAFTRLGMGDKATELFHLINPVNHSRTSIECARYKVEPYVMAADVYAVHPHVGRGGWTWYTGAAGWMYRVGMEYILGIRKDEGDILIDPCIPKNWGQYKVDYRYGSSIYRINISNPKGVNRGVSSITIDGRPLESNRIKLEDDGAEHIVDVIMG